jgi:hypothetical protein
VRWRRDSPPGATRGRRVGADRGQSEVVGVAVLLGVTMLSLGVVTATIGGVVQQQAASADAARVSTDFESSLRPVAATGDHRGSVSFAEGELVVVDRDVRILAGGRTVRRLSAGALVYRDGGRRVAFLAGAIVRGRGEGARFQRAPPISADSDVLVAGVPTLNHSGATAVSGDRTTVPLRTNVTHRRHALGRGTWRLAVETETPAPWTAYVRRHGATVSTRDFDGDGVESVVATFPGRRTAYLVVHAMHLEVGGRG